jgi:hypothetical protein
VLVLSGPATLGGEASDVFRRDAANLADLAETCDQQCSLLLMYVLGVEGLIYLRYWMVPFSKSWIELVLLIVYTVNCLVHRVGGRG